MFQVRTYGCDCCGLRQSLDFRLIQNAVLERRGTLSAGVVMTDARRALGTGHQIVNRGTCNTVDDVTSQLARSKIHDAQAQLQKGHDDLKRRRANSVDNVTSQPGSHTAQLANRRSSLPQEGLSSITTRLMQRPAGSSSAIIRAVCYP